MLYGTDFKCSINEKREKTVNQSDSDRPGELEGKRREHIVNSSSVPVPGRAFSIEEP